EIAWAAPFSGLNRPAKSRWPPPLSDHGICFTGTPLGSTTSTRASRRQPTAAVFETVAIVGGFAERDAWSRAAAIVVSGGKCRVWMTGASTVQANRTAGGSKAGLGTIAWGASGTVAR